MLRLSHISPLIVCAPLYLCVARRLGRLGLGEVAVDGLRQRHATVLLELFAQSLRIHKEY